MVSKVLDGRMQFWEGLAEQPNRFLVSCPINYANQSDVEPGAGTMGAAKIRREMQCDASNPLPPQRNASPLDNEL